MAPFIIPLLMALGSGAQTAAGAASARGARKSQEQLTREQIEQQERESLRGTALTESGMDPFRQQQQQAKAMAMLDRLARSSYTPRKVTPSGPYAQYVPEVTGGFSYEMDPQLRTDAEALKTSVRAGRTAPTQTNAANYGKTATLDLGRVASGELDARTDAAFSMGAPKRTGGAQQAELDALDEQIAGLEGRLKQQGSGPFGGLLKKAYEKALANRTAKRTKVAA
jgi:hypothetical protein